MRKISQLKLDFKLTDWLILDLDNPTETPKTNSTFAFQCGKTPYTRPRAFPSVAFLKPVNKGDNFIPFNKVQCFYIVRVVENGY